MSRRAAHSSLSDPRRFRSLAPIGSGGMGVVFGATDTWSRRPVALKVARGTRSLRVVNEQLRNEAVLQALAQGPHICHLHELTMLGRRACLVMERLTGESLQARLARGRLTNVELLRIARQLASAIASIHRVGLVHQDIKPSNVFLTRKGGVKVMDFGIATWVGAPSEGGSTTGSKGRRSVMGSPNYISPERLLHRPADWRSDLFSLGIVLYEMATGRPPFDSYSPIEMLLNVVDARTTPLLQLAPERPPALAHLIHTLLARRVGDRYQSATEVLKALRGIRAHGGTSAAVAS